jgi:hypothetical protein
MASKHSFCRVDQSLSLAPIYQNQNERRRTIDRVGIPSPHHKCADPRLTLKPTRESPSSQESLWPYLGGLAQDVHRRNVRPLESVERQAFGAVLVLQRNDQLRGPLLILAPRLDRHQNVFHRLPVISGRKLGCAPLCDEVVDQDQAVALLDGADLVLAVRVEGAVVDLVQVARGKVESGLSAAVADDKLACRVQERCFSDCNVSRPT